MNFCDESLVTAAIFLRNTGVVAFFFPPICRDRSNVSAKTAIRFPFDFRNSFQYNSPLFRKQTRVGKARTVSEPSFSDVELRCSHFASPCIARCSQSEPDDIEPSLQSIDDIFAPLPFQMMTTPPADIDLPLWDKPLVDGRSFLTLLPPNGEG